MALVESCFGGGGLGADLGIDGDGPVEHALFNERGARAIVSVHASLLARVLGTARQYGVSAQRVGQVTRDKAFRIQYKRSAAIDSPLESLRDVWAHSLERALKVR